MKKLTLFFVLSVFIAACHPDKNENPAPQSANYNIETGTAQNITNYKTDIVGSITNVADEKISQYGHVWSKEQNPTIELETKTELGSLGKEGEFTSQLTDLERGTTYYVRAYTVDENGTYYGVEKSFQTQNIFFRFEVGHFLRDYSWVNDRGWVAVYSNDGTIIGCKEIFNYSNTEFNWPESTTSEEFMVQIFTLKDDTDYYSVDRYNLDCYLKVKPGVWNLNIEQKQNSEIGKNNVKIGIENLENTWGSNKYFSYDFYNPNDLYFNQYYAPDMIFITCNDNTPAYFYKLIDNVELNQNFTLDKSDFTQMTDYVDISLPENDLTLINVQTKDDKDLGLKGCTIFDGKSKNETSMKVYFPEDLFESYATSIQVVKGNSVETNIKSNGDIPSEFIHLPIDIVINKNNITDFNMKVIGEADLASVEWEYMDYSNYPRFDFIYLVHGPIEAVSNFKAPEIPGIISSVNEDVINLDKLMYCFTGFIDWDIYENYSDYRKSNTFPKADGANELYAKYFYLGIYIYKQENKKKRVV